MAQAILAQGRFGSSAVQKSVVPGRVGPPWVASVVLGRTMHGGRRGGTRLGGGGNGGSGRSTEVAKDPWFCRSCKNDDGQPFRNFGHRSTCYRCRLHKGVCFGGKATSGGPPSRSTYGEQQVRQAEAAAKHAKALAAKQAEIDRLRSELQRGSDGVGDAAVEATPMEEYEFTVEQLQAQRSLLVSQGKAANHPMVVAIDGQVREQQAATLATKPAHVRIARADKDHSAV